MPLTYTQDKTFEAAKQGREVYSAGFQVRKPRGKGLSGQTMTVYFETYDQDGGPLTREPHIVTLAYLKATYPTQFEAALPALKTMIYAEGQLKYGNGSVS